jgi:hypothetical protein
LSSFSQTGYTALHHVLIGFEPDDADAARVIDLLLARMDQDHVNILSFVRELYVLPASYVHSFSTFFSSIMLCFLFD